MIGMKTTPFLARRPARFFGKLGVIALATALPVMMAGCGSAGSGTALKSSASLAPEPKLAIAQAGPPSSAAALSTAATASSDVAKEAAKLQGPTEALASIAVATAKMDAPPVPVRRPYRKVRSNKSRASLATKIKSGASEVAKSSPRKPELVKKVAVEKLPVKTAIKPVVVEPVIAKTAEVPMVPVQVMPVQIMPSSAPQDIVDAFNEAPAKVTDVEPEKMAKAQPVPVKHSFGQAEHNFSGR